MDLRVLIICLTGVLLYGQTSNAADMVRAKARQKQIPSTDRFNFFDMDLFEAVSTKQRPEGNFLISPLSVKVALGMVMEGAKGQTAEEIRTGLRFPNDRMAAREAFGRWLKSLQSQKSKSTLEIANHLFLSDTVPLLQDYNTTLTEFYQADITKVNFKSPGQAADKVNAWAKQSTRGLIPQLVSREDLAPNTKMLLTNAVYFKGNWADPFNKEKTVIKCFYSASGVCQLTHMMTQSNFLKYAYINTLDAQAVDLPYEDGKFSMLVILPSQRNVIQQLARDLVHVHHEYILEKLENKEVFLQLPRFDITFFDDLVEAIASLKISRAFGSQADLRGISNESLSIGQFIHSTKIIVNEEGSEAAAVSGAVFVPLIGHSKDMFVADHPFIFTIRDTSTGTILFAGRVTEPVEASLEAAFLPEQPRPEDVPQLPQDIRTIPPPVIMRPVASEQSVGSKKPGRPEAPPPPSASRPGGFQEMTPVGFAFALDKNLNPASTPVPTPELPLSQNGETPFPFPHIETTSPPPLVRVETTSPPPLVRVETTSPPPLVRVETTSPLPLFHIETTSPPPLARVETTSPPPLIRVETTPLPFTSPLPLFHIHTTSPPPLMNPKTTVPPPVIRPSGFHPEASSTSTNSKRNVGSHFVFSSSSKPRFRWFLFPEFTEYHQAIQETIYHSSTTAKKAHFKESKLGDRISFLN